MNFKGAIFDMDGTLIDSLMLWDVIWSEFGRRFLNDNSFRPTPDEDKKIRTMVLKEAMDFIHFSCGIGNSGAELLDAANKIMFDFYFNEVKLKEGVLEFLEYCFKHGIKMCIASATEIPLIQTAVKHCGIDKYFSDILSCADTAKGKDNPDIYIRALKSLGTSPEETCIFEDSLVAIRTASALGVKTVGIYDKYNYGHSEMEKISDEYIANGETLKKLIV